MCGLLMNIRHRMVTKKRIRPNKFSDDNRSQILSYVKWKLSSNNILGFIFSVTLP